MRKQYKKANDQIHVPEELMQRTQTAIRQEERRMKVRSVWKYAAAACFCLICIAGWQLAAGDKVVVQQVVIASDEMTVGMNAGRHEIGKDSDKETLAVETYDSREDVPEEMWELEPSRLDGQEVYIGRTVDGTWHTVFEKAGKSYYVTEEKEVEEKEFIEKLKKVIEDM